MSIYSIQEKKTTLPDGKCVVHRSIATLLMVGLLQACGGAEDAAGKPGELMTRSAAQATSTALPKLGAEDTDSGRVLDTTGTRTIDIAGRPPAHQSGLGMNLERFSYYSGDFPTLDVFKRANNPSGWITTTDIYSWGDEDHTSLLTMDENGWIKQLPVTGQDGKPRYARAFMFKDDQNAHPLGVYTIVYEGDGELVFTGMQGAATKLPDQSDGKHRAQVTIGKDTIFSILIKATQPANYVRNIQMIAPGGVCSGDKLTVVDTEGQCGGSLGKFISMETLSRTQIWYPTFLKDLAGTRTLRFMDWGVTNDNTVDRWSDRSRWDNAFWGSNKGVPVGAMINLANMLNADPWINIPFKADDDYIRQAARLLKNNLNPNLKAVFEYGNEPWNPSFGTYGQARTEGNKVFEGMGEEWDRSIQWSSMRAAQTCQLVKAEFGADPKRAHCTVNGWASNVWTTQNQVLPCKFATDKKLLPQACGKYFDSVSIAPYFGGYIGELADSRHFMLTNWFNRGDVYALGELFKEIRAKDDAGNDLAITPFAQAKLKDAPKQGALKLAGDWTNSYVQGVSQSGDYRLPIMAYEAGQHLFVAPNDCKGDDSVCRAEYEQFKPLWINLFKKANRDPRMAPSYQTYMTNWTFSGAQAISMFNHTGAYSASGAWGLRENYLQPMDQTPKWQVVAPFRTSACWWAGCKD